SQWGFKARSLQEFTSGITCLIANRQLQGLWDLLQWQDKEHLPRLLTLQDICLLHASVRPVREPGNHTNAQLCASFGTQMVNVAHDVALDGPAVTSGLQSSVQPSDIPGGIEPAQRLGLAAGRGGICKLLVS
ncbi:unnamed protein product, partial [Cladocopium goreaui]